MVNGVSRSRRPSAVPRRPIGAFALIDEQRATVVATDGACLKNPGPGGWGWWISDETFASGSEPASTNNRMELMAIAEALQSTQGPVVIETDSSYAADAICSWATGWKKNNWHTSNGKPVKNRELIERILQLVSRREVLVRWVKGHAGHHGNERADALATAAARQAAA